MFIPPTAPVPSSDEYGEHPPNIWQDFLTRLLSELENIEESGDSAYQRASGQFSALLCIADRDPEGSSGAFCEACHRLFDEFKAMEPPQSVPKQSVLNLFHHLCQRKLPQGINIREAMEELLLEKMEHALYENPTPLQANEFEGYVEALQVISDFAKELRIPPIQPLVHQFVKNYRKGIAVSDLENDLAAINAAINP